MRHAFYSPAAPLDTLVKCFWYWESEPRPHAKEKILPNGELAVIFNLRNEPIRIYDSNDLRKYETYGHATISGARRDYFVIDTDEQERVLGIQFHAGGAFPFFRMPACEFEGANVDLANVWPAAQIREQLLEARSIPEIFRTLERFLFAQLVRPPESHPAVGYALREFQTTTSGRRIADVTESIGLSSRRFVDLFHRQVGLTPKAFCRVVRFQRVLQTIRSAQELDWTDIAMECGYYDQAHFIHDFQEFSGLTPSAYLAVATPHLNHVPVSAVA